MPGTLALCSSLTGMTYLPCLSVTIESWSISLFAEEDTICESFDLMASFCLSMEFLILRSSELAESAISSSEMTQRSISPSSCLSSERVCLYSSMYLSSGRSEPRKDFVLLAEARLYPTWSSCLWVSMPSLDASLASPLIS